MKKSDKPISVKFCKDEDDWIKSICSSGSINQQDLINLAVKELKAAIDAGADLSPLGGWKVVQRPKLDISEALREGSAKSKRTGAGTSAA